MTIKKNYLNLSLVSALTFLVTAGGPAAHEAIKIGASLPLTGNFSVSGQKHKEGYELCVDLVNQAGGIDGEGGTTGGLPALVSAIDDALASVGVPMIDLPATSERLWRALQSRI